MLDRLSAIDRTKDLSKVEGRNTRGAEHRWARSIPWLVAIVAVIAFAASFSELQRMRGRFGEVTRHQFHDHRNVREFMIKAALAGLDQPIVVIGDSIAEMARFPENVVNAGIGGASIQDIETLAPRLLDGLKPAQIVVVLGTNEDVWTIRRDYARLLSILKKFSHHIWAVAIPVQNDQRNAELKAAADREGIPLIEPLIPAGSLLPDGIHLNAAGNRVWASTILATIGLPAQ
jgi:lysophospholipase L1-like esterase